MAYVAYIFVWVSTCIAVTMAVWVTGEAYPLIGLLVPTLISIGTENHKPKKEVESDGEGDTSQHYE